MSGSDRTALYALIGNPVTQSLSPFIMNHAFADNDINAIYAAFGVHPDLLDVAISGLYSMGASGANVTYPYKEEILYHLDVISSDAEVAQAVNTIVFTDDEIHGYNTDAPGTVAALETFANIEVEGRGAFIYGCGGAARAAAFGMLERGLEQVTFCARSAETAEMAIERYHYVFPEQDIRFVPLYDPGARAARRRAFRDADIVINATPVGMSGVESGCLLEDPTWIRPEHCLFDFVYHPSQTPFLELGQKAEARTLGGVALLVSQAVESFRLWTDQTFDTREMAAMLEVIARAPRDSEEGVN